ncbi:MAG: glycosyltransferase [Planctomycetota bacterium]|nr:glycosyltransferase [Planctomycetota bacterium]
MKILQLTSSLSAKAGGPPMVVTRLAAAQAGLGHQVTLCSYETAPGDAESPVDMARAGGNLTNARLPRGGRLERVLPRAGMGVLRSMLPSFDILHIHSLWEPICLGASMEARRAGVPYALAPHGMLDPWALSEKALKKKVFLALAYRRMVERAGMIHALSAYEATSIRALGVRAPIETIPNGVFLEEIDPLPAPGSFHAARPELRGEPYALFLSRLHPVKGLDILAEAFARVLQDCPDARLVVVGPDWGAKEPLEAQAKSLGIAERVHLTGPLYAKDKFAAMVDASCFVLPSKHEAFSVAIVEALASSCPPVISEQCHFQEVADEGAGFCVPREPEHVARAMVMLLRDRPLRASMGAAGRAMVESKYTWPRIAAQSVEAYARARRPR